MELTRVHKAFFALIRCALTGGAGASRSLDTAGWFPLDADEWQELFELSGCHAVLGIVADAFGSLPTGSGIPVPLLANWLMYQQKIAGSYGKMKETVFAQTRFWADNGLHPVLLKGIGVSSFYPRPEFRTCGDVDWFFMPDEWDRALSLARSEGYGPEIDSEADYNYVVSDVIVEHHRRWNDLAWGPHRSAAGTSVPCQPLSAPEDGDLFPSVLDPMSNLLMLNAHILKHSMILGIGMRQVCDLAMAYPALSGQYDESVLARTLERCGLKRWTLVLHAMMDSIFGAGSAPDLWPGDRGRRVIRDSEILLSYILADGNFGHDNLSPENSHKIFGSGSIASIVSRRTLFFLRLAPMEFISRLWLLFRGRVRK